MTKNEQFRFPVCENDSSDVYITLRFVGVKNYTIKQHKNGQDCGPEKRVFTHCVLVTMISLHRSDLRIRPRRRDY